MILTSPILATDETRMGLGDPVSANRIFAVLSTQTGKKGPENAPGTRLPSDPRPPSTQPYNPCHRYDRDDRPHRNREKSLSKKEFWKILNARLASGWDEKPADSRDRCI
jgi:hypothetical protein